MTLEFIIKQFFYLETICFVFYINLAFMQSLLASLQHRFALYLFICVKLTFKSQFKWSIKYFVLLKWGLLAYIFNSLKTLISRLIISNNANYFNSNSNKKNDSLEVLLLLSVKWMKNGNEAVRDC